MCKSLSVRMVLDLELSSVISTDDTLLLNKSAWFWSTPRQGHVVALLLITLKTF